MLNTRPIQYVKKLEAWLSDKDKLIEIAIPYMQRFLNDGSFRNVNALAEVKQWLQDASGRRSE